MSASAPRDHLHDVHARVGAPRDDREPARVGREGRGLRVHLRGRLRQADLLPQPEKSSPRNPYAFQAGPKKYHSPQDTKNHEEWFETTASALP